MSLLWSANSDRVNLGTGASLDDLDPAVCIAWCYFASTPADGNVVYFKGLTGANGRMSCLFFNNGGINLAVTRRGTGVNLFAQGLLTNLANWATGKWVCLAFQCDTTTDGNNKVFCGDLTHPLAEPSAYTVQTKGSGISSYAGQAAFIGNNSALTNAPPANTKIAWVGIWGGRTMTLGEMVEQQFRPHMSSGSVLQMHVGFNGTGTQTDWSGNGNSGTVTGATLTPDHVPLMSPFGFNLAWQGAFTATGWGPLYAGERNRMVVA